MNMHGTLDALIVTYTLVMTLFPVMYLHWYTRREGYQWTLDRYEDAAERRAKLARFLVRARWRTIAGAGVVVSAWFWISGWLPQALIALPAFAALALLFVMPAFVPALRLAQAKRFDEFGFPSAAGPSRTASSALRRLTDYLPRYWIVLPAIIVVAGSLIVGWVSLSAATVSGALLAAEAVMLVIVLEFLWYSWRQLRRAPGLLPPDLTDAVDPAVLGEAFEAHRRFLLRGVYSGATFFLALVLGSEIVIAMTWGSRPWGLNGAVVGMAGGLMSAVWVGAFVTIVSLRRMALQRIRREGRVDARWWR